MHAKCLPDTDSIHREYISTAINKASMCSGTADNAAESVPLTHQKCLSDSDVCTVFWQRRLPYTGQAKC